MTTTNSYKDTKAIDYLEAIKRNQLESRNAKSSSSNFDMTYSLPMTSNVGVVTSFTNTEKTLADYQVTNNIAKLVAYFPFDYDVNDAMNSNHGTLTNSGICWLKLNEDVNDSIGTNHGTVTGTTTYVAGQIDNAFSFNGSSYITLANESNFDFDVSNAFSIAFWTQTSTDSGMTYIAKKNAQTAANIGWSVIRGSGNDTFNVLMADGTNQWNVSSSLNVNPADGVWRHFVMTYSGSGNRNGVKIYVNGVLDATGTSDTTVTTLLNNLSPVVGAESDAGVKFTGLIDDLMIFDFELTSTIISSIYALTTDDYSTLAYSTGIEVAPYTRKAFDTNGLFTIEVANESNFDFEYDDPFSVALWLKMDSIASDQAIITKSTNLTTALGWKIYFQNTSDYIVFKLADGTNAFSVTSTSSLLASKWYHIVCTFSGNSNQSGMKIYVNGTLEATGASSAISSTILNNTSVFIASANNTEKLDGHIDELTVWNVELSSSDVTDLYNTKQINKNTSVTNPAILGFSDVS